MSLHAEALSTKTLDDFTVIPVIDLKDGLVVHARAGKRAEYRPIATPYGPPHDSAAIARALLGITFSPTLYVADLDALRGKGNNFAVCRELANAFPATALWIDAGFSDVTDCAFWLPLGATLVIGSESLASLEAWGDIRAGFGHNVVLSLDFDHTGFRGPQALMADPSLWPGRLILMGLDRVGTEIGPDLTRLKTTLRLDPGREVYVAGGVRDLGDIERVSKSGARGVLAATALHSGAVSQKEIAALLRERRFQS